MINNLNHFGNFVHLRVGQPVEGMDGWTWIKEDGLAGSDGGAWVGPYRDWYLSHVNKYFTHVKKYGVVIQAGGALGMYPRLLATKFEFVYTFEPDPLNFYCLVNNCQVDNIIKFNAALGEKNEFVRIERCTNNAGAHRVHLSDTGRMPVLSIDSFNFPDCDMIILDVEGYERSAIKGALKTIEKYKPVIVAEYTEESNRELLDLIGEFGYKIIDKSAADLIYATE